MKMCRGLAASGAGKGYAAVAGHAGRVSETGIATIKPPEQVLKLKAVLLGNGDVPRRYTG